MGAKTASYHAKIDIKTEIGGYSWVKDEKL
jgi:hypothetical protein